VDNRERAQMLGTNLRAARRKAGMTQPQVAGACGITKKSLSEMERGLIAPRVSTLVCLGHVLAADPAELLKGLRP
jgi:transcriptional regulator with XRE-family HTH domain